MATTSQAAANTNSRVNWLDLNLRNPWRSACVVFGYVVLHAALDSLGLALTTTTAPGGITIWPSAGLVLGIFLLTRPGTWPIWTLGSVAAHLLAADFSVWSLGFAITVPLQAATVAVIRLSYFTERPAEQTGLHPLLAGVGLAVVATGIFALVPAMMLSTHYGVALSTMWRFWWAANCLGTLLGAPLVVAWLTGQPQPLFDRPARAAETLAILASIGILGLAMLVPSSPAQLGGLPRETPLLLVLPLLTWAALRYDGRIVTAASFLLTMATAAALSRSSGPFASAATTVDDATLGVQLFLLVVIVAALTLRLVNLEKIETQNALRARLGLEQIMLSLATRTSSPAAATLDQQIEAALGELAEFAQADRAHLLQVDHANHVFSGTHFWCRPGVEAIDYLLRERRLAEFEWEMDQLRQGRLLAFDDLSKLPPEASGLRMIHDLSGRGATGIYYVPVLSEGELLGVVGLSWLGSAMVWREELRALEKVIGQFFVNAILRTRAERGLLEYQQKLRSLAAEMSLAEERVRRRAAVDLHDGIGQYLAVARIKLGQLLASGTPSTEDVEAVRELVDSALKQTRYIISDLSPTVLYELGLVPAIEWLAERTEPQANIHINVTEDSQPDGPDEEARVIMFQVVRELLANVVKHAKATEVGIHVTWHPGVVQMLITDNGIGFREDRLENLAPERGGFGLFSIRERLRSMHGDMAIDSSRGIGTRITVSCPLPRRAAAEPGARPQAQLSVATTRNPSSTKRVAGTGSAPRDVTRR